MHPSVYAKSHPDRAAYVMATSGEVVTYRDLDERSNQAAHLLHSLGLKTGDVVAVCMDNNPRFFEVVWGAQRSGLYYACISSKLSAGEIDYIVRDCGARALVVSPGIGAAADELPGVLPGDVKLFMTGAASAPYTSWQKARDVFPTTAVSDGTAGGSILYSSGTTGKPKGIKRPLTGGSILDKTFLDHLMQGPFAIGEARTYLSPAPLYHAAPLGWALGIHRLGGTVIVMEKFDPEHVLQLIERYQIEVAQFVPTHFVRMLKLPAGTAEKYDVSSLVSVIHAAAPCPIPVKEQMIGWFGPIIHEYYSGSEGIGFCHLTSEEWLAHKGSVGRAIVGKIQICDEDGEPLPPRREGVVHFSDGPPLSYHNAPEKVAENSNKYGWTTLGDVGWVDEEGYLYLTDRRSFMIISGGVNIYPQEIENLLIMHPKVADAAVVGAPNEDMGEEVAAVIQPQDWNDAGPALRDELLAYAKANLSHVKTPRRLDFMQELPRHPNGKLYKRLLRDSYWGKGETTIV
ncbi:MAG: acyl-CoA synthetase [Sphingomonadaceae bacterium]|jgi:long-chain acyl-CoA synthetase|nr:acyl-CoA synthetase [Sphingomonadaceae bacterium]NBU79391.1 acyl-CoA synthetase [Sphingomonadaceae bacterium]NCA00892.1 acyl-CoA synthetase [Sphingomonadaceae bacterium]